MKKLSKGEIFLRVFSVALGILLWYIVLNTSNPIETRNIVLPLEIYNERDLERNTLGLYEGAIPETVSVALRGRRKDLDGLVPGSVSAYTDFAMLNQTGEVTLDINIFNKNEKLTVISHDPFSIELVVEKIIEKTFPVEVLVSGEPAENFKLISVEANPEEISVKGFESEIALIDSVIAVFDISNADRDKTISKYLQFMNNRGEEISGLSRSFSADLSATIGRRVTINPVIEGTPAYGYYYNGITSNVEAVYITGPIDVISKIYEVRTAALVIDGLKEDMLFELNPVIANNISIISVDGEMTATVIIEELKEKSVIYRKNDVLLIGADHINNIYEVVTDSVDVKIRGKEETLDTLLRTDINILMDVSDLEPGFHNVRLDFEYTREIEIIGQYSATLSITARPVDPPLNGGEETN